MTARALGTWVREALQTAPGLLNAYRPAGPVEPRLRERMLLAMAETDTAPIARWIHQGWLEFLGERPPAEGDDALVADARRCAEADRPLPSESRTLRAVVASGAVGDTIDNAATNLLGAVTGRVPLTSQAFVDAALVAAAAPVAIPALLTSSGLRMVSRFAPPMPTVERPDGEANLLAHLLVAAAPSIFANAAVRTIALRLPRMVDIGMRHGRTTATLRVGQGRVAVENFVTKDAIVVIEGEVEPLLRHASGSIVRELRSLRLRPG